MTRNVQIDLHPAGYGTVIALDGQHIPNVRKLVLTAEAGQLTTLELTIVNIKSQVRGDMPKDQTTIQTEGLTTHTHEGLMTIPGNIGCRQVGYSLSDCTCTELKRRDSPQKRPKIVCLCGSSRFADAFAGANLQETLAGNIVVTIGANMRNDDLFRDMSDEELRDIKTQLDVLHFHKIDLADEVLILNVDGYVGDSTLRELYYAQSRGKIIRWWEEAKPHDYY